MLLTPVALKGLFTAICPFLLAACATLSLTPENATLSLNGNSLNQAEALACQSKSLTTRQPDTAAIYQLRAAEIAWNSLDTDGGQIKSILNLPPEQQRALHILTTATEAITLHFIQSGTPHEKTFTLGSHSYRVSSDSLLRNVHSATLAHSVKHSLCNHWHTENGVGVPLASVWKKPADTRLNRFVSSSGYAQPITTVLNFSPLSSSQKTRRASLTTYDSTATSRVQLGRTQYPLAADFTAPIVSQIAEIQELKIALTGLVHPGQLDSKLILLQPHDPKRIPVLLVHGLNSHPRMWRNVLNDLRADPKLRDRYQFMLFYYPTGWPISYSSLRLREELAAFQATVGIPQKMILIGHSMGGLLSRMQVIDSGHKIWDGKFGNSAEKLYQKLPANHLAKRMAIFSANPNIAREIYICTPHRGSRLADLSLTSWFIKILSIPTKITTALIDIPTNLTQRGSLTSVAGLSPTNPLFKSIADIPIQVPHHSIIGDRGKGDTPNSSDGVVPYWSSHLESAQSEKIVPKNHSSYQDASAIEEIRRILLLHAHLEQ